MTRARTALATALLVGLPLTACGSSDEPAAAPSGPPAAVTAPLTGPDGAELGRVELRFPDDGPAELSLTATGMPPGPHGFHVHTTGLCEPDSPDPADPSTRGDFLSAGGHLADEGQVHGDHDGDLPSLLVAQDGSGRLVVTSDRLTREAVLDSDGAAVMVHAAADNFGNVPERYAPTTDETTRKTGDSGGRIACGVLEE